MWVLSICRRAVLGFSVALLLVVGFCYCDDKLVDVVCYCDDKLVDVVGNVECADCMGNNIKSRDILLGLQVNIKCKVAGSDQLKTTGVGKLDEEGKFKVTLPKEMVKDDHSGQLMEDCFANLIPGAGSDVHACPMATENGVEASSKIVLIKSKEENNIKHYTFSPTGKLAFSALPCSLSSSSVSSLKDLKFLPFPKFHLPLHKTLPKFHIPPKVLPKKPSLPIIKKKPFLQPIHKKPFPIPSFSKKPFLPPIPEENQKFLLIPKIPHILKKKFIHHHLPKFLPPKHLPHP